MNPSFVGSGIYKFYFINAKKINNLKFKGKVGNILRIRKSFWDKINLDISFLLPIFIPK